MIAQQGPYKTQAERCDQLISQIAEKMEELKKMKSDLKKALDELKKEEEKRSK